MKKPCITMFTDLMALLLLCFIAPLLFLFVLLSAGFGRHRSIEKAYHAYLPALEGTCFFCYNNRKNSKDFIEKNILPALSPNIKIIYLDGRTPQSGYDQNFISAALMRYGKGFPYMFKISNGKMVYKSINNDFYNTMNQKKDMGQFIQRVNSFD